MNPADMKRMVLMDGDRTGIRKKTMQLIQENKITKDEQVQMGNALESMTQNSGWAYIEAYIFRNANLSEILLTDDQSVRLEARGLIKLLHYVNNMITVKNELLRKADEKE
jgi:hypothetical protein